MTGQENYTRAIEFKGPAYLPCAIRLNLDWLHEKDAVRRQRLRELQDQFPDDMLAGVKAVHHEAEPVCVDGVLRRNDEWGTGWVDDGHGAKTESYPLVEGYEALAGYVVPDPNRPGRFDEADAQLKGRGDRYVRASVWFTLFERLWMLRGFENMLMDPYMNETGFCRLRDAIVEHNLAIVDQFVKRGVQAVFFSDDWGSQRGLLMNPDDWRRFYKPSYQRMFDRVHAGGAHVWMHSCGYIGGPSHSIMPETPLDNIIAMYEAFSE